MPASELTESDRRFLEVAITCLKEPPQLDVPKIAEKLGIKNKSVTNKWWEIKKKLWGVEVARQSGEKTRQLSTAAVAKRKQEERAANAPPPKKPVREKMRFYTGVPPAAAAAPPHPEDSMMTTATTGTTTMNNNTTSGVGVGSGTLASPVVIQHDGGAGAGPGGGHGDRPAYEAAAPDVTMNAGMGLTTTGKPATATTTGVALKKEQMNGDRGVDNDDDAHDFGGPGEDAGVI